MRLILVAMGLIILAIAPGMAIPSITGDSPAEGFTTWYDDFSDRAGQFDFDGVLGGYSTTGSGLTTTITSGEKWRVAQTGSGTSTAGWDGSTSSSAWDMCAEEPGAFGGFSFTLIVPDDPPTSGQDVRVGLNANTAGSGNQISFTFTPGATTSVSAQLGNAGAFDFDANFATGFLPGDILTATVGAISCSGTSATFIIENATDTFTTVLDATGSTPSGLWDSFNVASAPTTGDGVFLFDDVTITTALVTVEATVLCPDPAAGNFGYNYVEDVTFSTPASVGVGSISLNDFYKFTGDVSNNAYLAKGWPSTPTRDFYTRATVEAATEGTSGRLRVVFSYEDPTPWISANNFTAAAKGDGSTTGAFTNSTEVQFTENGNDWDIKIIQTLSGSRTQIGPAFSGGSPNTATGFQVGIDSDLGYIYVQDSDGNILLDSEGITNNRDVYSLWLVGSGLAVADSYIAVNDNDGAFNSSCWFFNDVEPILLGNPGSLPFAEGITEPPVAVAPAFDTTGTLFDLSPLAVAMDLPVGILEVGIGLIVTGLIAVGMGMRFENGGVIGGFIGVVGFTVVGYFPLWIVAVLGLLLAVMLVYLRRA